MFKGPQRTILEAKIPVEGVDYLSLGHGIKEYILLKDYVIRWKRGTVEFKIVVPANFNTDFGTTHKGIFNEPYMLPGYIGHDFGYFEHTNSEKLTDPWYFYRDHTLDDCPDAHAYECWKESIADWKRPEWDSLMRDLHEHHKAPWWKRALVYRAVRLFGGPYWKS